MKYLILIFLFHCSFFWTNVANAYDFYGASVTVKEVSMSMWRMGINGNYPIIDSIALNSPAAKAGLSQGNIILSINDRVIKSVFDLDAFTTNVLSVKILKGYARETIIIDRIAIEAEKAKRIAEEKKSVVKASAPNRDTEVEELSNDSRPLVFNDAILEKKLGRSTPAELAKQREVSEQNLRNEGEKERAKRGKKAQKSSQGTNFAEDYYLIDKQLIKAASTRTESVPFNTNDKYGRPYTTWSNQQYYEPEEWQVTIENDGEVWSFRIICGNNDLYSKMTVAASQLLHKLA